MSEADPKAEFIDAAVWHGSLERAEAILAAHPEIAGSDIYMAALLADDAAVRRFLDADPASATAKGGPKGWDALTYLCFSKYLRLDPARSDAFLRAATALLDAGASPNTGFYEANHGPKPTIECVLYGAAGVAHHPEMTRLLINRGADPNDDEVAYHTPETLDNRAMKVLVESGKLTPETKMWLLCRKLNWHDDDGVAWLLDNGVDPNFQAPWGQRPLHQALKDGVPISYFELFLDKGADPTLPGKEGTSSIALAARMARADVLDLFERRGWAAELQGEDAFLAACTRADAATARRLIADDPGLLQRVQAENEALLTDFAGSDNTAALALMLDLGFDVHAALTRPNWMVGVTALHVATGRGLLANAKLLIERGAPLEAKTAKGHTPLAVAVRCFEQQSEWTPNDYVPGIAQALIDAGANVESAGMTLAAAVCLGRTDDQARLAQTAGPKEKQVALAAAAYYGITSAVPMLVALGADPNGANLGLHPDATPLHNAVCSGSLETVKALVAAGANPNGKDRAYRATPLSWAEYFMNQKRTCLSRTPKSQPICAA